MHFLYFARQRMADAWIEPNQVTFCPLHFIVYAPLACVFLTNFRSLCCCLCSHYTSLPNRIAFYFRFMAAKGEFEIKNSEIDRKEPTKNRLKNSPHTQNRTETSKSKSNRNRIQNTDCIPLRCGNGDITCLRSSNNNNNNMYLRYTVARSLDQPFVPDGISRKIEKINICETYSGFRFLLLPLLPLPLLR